MRAFVLEEGGGYSLAPSFIHPFSTLHSLSQVTDETREAALYALLCGMAGEGRGKGEADGEEGASASASPALPRKVIVFASTVAALRRLAALLKILEVRVVREK